MKKLFFIIVIGIVVLILAGAIYGYVRSQQLSSKSLSPHEQAVPNTNPFESETNPFEFYPNPFESSFRTHEILAAQVVGAAGLSYPISDLGGCESEAACHAYCSRLENLQSCISFGEAHGLFSEEALAHASNFRGVTEGPGGCQTKGECDAYCGTLHHIQECVLFAEKHNVLSPEELREARQIARHISEGGTMPGDCNNKTECMAYCESREHIEECLAFGEAAGVIPPDELAEAKKVLPYLLDGTTPGGCFRKEECDAYCSEISHMEECIAFAEKAGLIPPEELKLAKKVLPLMLRGETPGGCTSKESCESYCQNPAHFSECLDFAEKAGIMSKAEILFLRQLLKFSPR